jgi:hypothetical protein
MSEEIQNNMRVAAQRQVELAKRAGEPALAPPMNTEQLEQAEAALAQMPSFLVPPVGAVPVTEETLDPNHLNDAYAGTPAEERAAQTPPEYLAYMESCGVPSDQVESPASGLPMED